MEKKRKPASKLHRARSPQRTALWILAALYLTGCGDNERYETLTGANERIGALTTENDELKHRIQELKEEKISSETDIANRYRVKLADAADKLASLRLELGAIQREKLALEETAHAGPRIERAKANRFAMERLVYLVIIGISLALAMLASARWKRTNDRLQHLVMNEVDSIRRLGVQR